MEPRAARPLAAMPQTAHFDDFKDEVLIDEDIPHDIYYVRVIEIDTDTLNLIYPDDTKCFDINNQLYLTFFLYKYNNKNYYSLYKPYNKTLDIENINPTGIQITNNTKLNLNCKN